MLTSGGSLVVWRKEDEGEEEERALMASTSLRRLIWDS